MPLLKSCVAPVSTTAPTAMATRSSVKLKPRFILPSMQTLPYIFIALAERGNQRLHRILTLSALRRGVLHQDRDHFQVGIVRVLRDRDLPLKIGQTNGDVRRADSGKCAADARNHNRRWTGVITCSVQSIRAGIFQRPEAGDKDSRGGRGVGDLRKRD